MAGRKKSATRATPGRGYRIGTVSHLTGIDPHTIRAWERRYQAIRPGRSEGGARLYSDHDVARLQLIKAAVDTGDAISTVAPLSDDELRSRLAQVAGLARKEVAARLDDLKLEGRALRLGVLGGLLAEQLRANAAGLAQLDVVVAETGWMDCADALRSQPVDVLLVAFETLGTSPAEAFRTLKAASGARLCLIVYEFGRRRDLAQLADIGAKLVHGPLSVAQLRRAIFDLLVIHESRKPRARLEGPIEIPVQEAEPPARLFTDRQIARLAEIASSVDCECPNHLSSLISNLARFEAYSHECKNQSPEDAVLHSRLALGTGRARAVIEQLLVEVCAHDGIRL